MKKIAIVVGTRPEAIKLGPIASCLKKTDGLEPIIIFTGQHRELAPPILQWFGIDVDYDLDLMSARQELNEFTAAAVSGLDKILQEIKPYAVLSQGDTMTAFIAALAAFHLRIKFGHVEAGLRTYNLSSPFPEEAYRQMTSRLADWHFAPTKRAAKCLQQERVQGEIHVVGNSVIDALKYSASIVGKSKIKHDKDKLVLITLHRRENFGEPMQRVIEAIKKLSSEFNNADFIFPVHPNPAVREVVEPILGNCKNVQLIEPLEYTELIALMKEADLILTDSGGIQEEAPSFGVPVLVVRDNTEREEAVIAGACKLVGTNTKSILDCARGILEKQGYRHNIPNPYGDGETSIRIANILLGDQYAKFDG